jgi:hypothetical protein
LNISTNPEDIQVEQKKLHTFYSLLPVIREAKWSRGVLDVVEKNKYSIALFKITSEL